ncbi:Kalirin, partial [Geodia barretti]
AHDRSQHTFRHTLPACDWCREEARANGFCVIMDGNVMADFMQVTIIRALNQFQHDMSYVKTFLYVSSSPMPDWDTLCGSTIDLPLTHVSDHDGLLEHADRSQLMPDLGGYLEYEHEDWVRFRMQVEPFLCDCVSISKLLAQAIAPFTKDMETPTNLEETKEVLKKHQLKKRRTIDQLQIDELTSQGLKINKLIKQESEERRSSIQFNPEFLSTIATVGKLISNMEAVKERVEGMWHTRGEKLEATYKQQTFEKEANQIIEWFEQFTNGVAQTHTELGESQQVAESLAKEVTDFETTTQQILIRTEKLLQSGTILETLKHTDHDTISTLMGKIKQLMTDFDDRLGKRKKKIDESVQLHKLTEMSLDWCIESAGLLSDFDLLCNSEDFNPAAAIVSIDQFLDENPAPSAENQQMLMELAEITENHWAKQNALFAFNRVMEISERFSYHSQMLES